MTVQVVLGLVSATAAVLTLRAVTLCGRGATIPAAPKATSTIDHTEARLISLPMEIQDKILNEHLDLESCCRIVLAHPPLITVADERLHTELLQPSLDAHSISIMLRTITSTIRLRYAPALTRQQSMGLYHLIRWSDALTPVQKASLMRVLVQRLRVPELRNETALWVPGGRDRLYIFLDLGNTMLKSVSRTPPSPIPDPIRATVQQWVDDHVPFYRQTPLGGWIHDRIHGRGRIQNREEGGRAGPNPIFLLRQRYPAPFCHLHENTPEVALHLLKSFDARQHPLRDRRTVLALRQYGFVFRLRDYLTHVEVDPECAPDLVPMLRLDSPETLMAEVRDLVRGGGRGPDLALEILRIPFIRNGVAHNSLLTLKYLTDCLLGCNAPWTFITAFCDLPLMSMVIDREFEFLNTPGNHKLYTLLDVAIITQNFDTARLLMRLPNASLSVGTCRGLRYVMFSVLTGRMNMKLRDFMESPEFVRLSLADIPKLLETLRSFQPSRVEFRRLSELDFVKNIPGSFRSEILNGRQEGIYLRH